MLIIDRKRDSGASFSWCIENGWQNFHPNEYEIMELILTFPIGAVPCERLFSTSCWLNDWSQSTMLEGIVWTSSHVRSQRCRNRFRKCF